MKKICGYELSAEEREMLRRILETPEPGQGRTFPPAEYFMRGMPERRHGEPHKWKKYMICGTLAALAAGAAAMAVRRR